jgi:outer membrane immunogenic protein
MTAPFHHRTRQILAGALLLAAGTGVSSPAEAQVQSWSGFYAGVNTGYGFGSSTATVTGFAPGYTPEYQAYIPVALRRSMNPDGPLGGLQAGYNIHHGALLVGLEADAQYMRLRGTNDSGIIAGPVPAAGHNVRLYDTLESQSLFTLRLRGGWTTGQALLYATGGLAAGKIKATRDSIFLAGANPYDGSSSSMHWGWTAGAGLEYAVTERWSVKAEYLFVKFDDVAIRASSRVFAAEYIDSAMDVKAHILRVGLNYRFGN